MLGQLFSWHKLTWFHYLQYSYADVHWASFSRLHFTSKLKILILMNYTVKNKSLANFFRVFFIYINFWLVLDTPKAYTNYGKVLQSCKAPLQL